MKVLGIIAEYNPFHNGHLYHLEKSKEITGADFVVAVMSGNFLQRGEPAMLDKWVRSEIAVANGIDLVIELPFAFACNHAGMFAKGAVEILERLGCITHLSFGSEASSLDSLLEIAKITVQEGDAFHSSMINAMNGGDPYAAARQRAVKEMGGEDLASLMNQPNNILAIEYLRHLILANSQIQPVIVRREGPGYHDLTPTDHIASATYLRNKVGRGEDIRPYIPQATQALLEMEDGFVGIEDFFPLIQYRLLQQRLFPLDGIYAAGEGLENRFIKYLRTSQNLMELIQKVKSKRYAETRVKRLIFQGLNGLTKELFNDIINKKISYARVLAFNEKGQKLIREIKKKELADIPFITNINKEIMPLDPLWKLLQIDVMASDVYNLGAGKKLYEHSDFVKRPYRQI